MKRFLILLAAIALLAGVCAADEGMWLFNAPPKDQIKAKYKFDLTQEFLDHLRLSSVRMGASASFVSPDGLVFTNHHVGAGCVHDLSTNGRDYMRDGFYAATRAQEQPCPGLEVNVLIGIEDITSKIHAAAKPGMTPAEFGAAQRQTMSELEKACSTDRNTRCETVTLYAGGMYHVYKYRKYSDIRLVFAPEFDAAFFGGDPDNFTYPRYDLDITFFRVYENGKPVRPEHYLTWSKTGVKEGDLVFVSGHPGSTGRMLTQAQLEYLRDFQYPFILNFYKHRIELLQKFGAESPENARIAERELFSLQNSFKAITGYQSGLLDKQTMTLKANDQKELQSFVTADAKRKAEYGDPWGAISKAVATQKGLYLPYSFVDGSSGLRGRMAEIARTLVRITAEREKPNARRLRGYQDSAIPSIEQRLFSTAPIYRSLEIANLADGLTSMRQYLGADNATVKQILNGKEPLLVAKELIDNSKLDDVAFRKQLYEGGRIAVEASTDPLIQVMRAIDPEARQLRTRYEDEVDSVLRQNGAIIAKIRFAKFGTSLPPDATGTLRLSYGVVKGYHDNGKRIPWATNFAGAYEHAQKADNIAPFDLPHSWDHSRYKLDLNTPLDVVSTPDIIGGNSGSPVVNTKGEIVGIIFDGNIQSLPWNFMYEDKIGRAVHTDSRAVIEALRKIYRAQALADELQSTATAKASEKKPTGTPGQD